jgi:ribonuclease HII
MDTIKLVASLDEVGRGSLAGPVVAACVVWKPGEFDHLIRDSKKLSAKRRLELVDYIKDNAIDYSIAFIDAARIDEVNILNATFEAMHQCLDQLNMEVDHIMVDGNSFRPYNDVPHTCIIGGDDKEVSIGAASILAKVARDEYMADHAKIFPEYGWEYNSGYGTKKHISALKEHGPTIMHRKSFLQKIKWNEN